MPARRSSTTPGGGTDPARFGTALGHPLSRRAFGAIALGSAATWLVGCSDSDDSSPAAASTAEPRRGGTLGMLAVSDSAQLDPFRTVYMLTVDEPRMNALYDPLLIVDCVSKKVEPHLAESLTTTDGGATWTLRLRPGVRFSDGTTFDAEAVRVNWEMHTRPEVRSVHAAAAGGLTLTVVDPLTLQIRPPAPNANFDRTVATELSYIASPAQLAKGPDVYGREPVGAGPFVLSGWERGHRQIFTRNPDYWQKDKGLPYLDGFTVTALADEQQQLNSIRSGGAHIFGASAPELIKKADGDAISRVVNADGGQFMQFNCTRAPFDDVRARRAIALAVDSRELAAVAPESYLPATGLFASDSPWFNSAAVQPAGDRAKAQELFDTLAAEGRKVSFTFLVPRTARVQRTSELIQSRLSTYRNVEMRIEPLEIGAFTVRLRVQRDFQAVLNARYVFDPEPELYNAYHTGNVSNLGGWSNAMADKALEDGRASSDPQVRRDAYARFQAALVEDMPQWVYSQSVVAQIHHRSVAGLRMYNSGSPMMDRIGLT